MRRLALLTCLLLGSAAMPAAARADDYVGAPETHGPDSLAINQGPTMPPPAGGPLGGLAKQGVNLGAEAVRKLLPSQWCGQERATDDTTDELSNGAYKYHAVYMLPADGVDHLRANATQLESDSFAASGLLERLYGRAIRFDLGTSCGPQYLDISVVRMQQTSAQLSQLAQSATGTFDAITNSLQAAGFATIQSNETVDQAQSLTKNYVVWLDGPTPSDTCGQGTIYDDPSRSDQNLNNLGGKVAAIYPDGSGGFCDSNTVRHEIGHTLGALQKVAPHAFDGMHCNDAAEDTMCYPNVSPQRANGQEGLYFDYSNDDYWDPTNGPTLPWWTVNLNRFLCPIASCNVVPGAINSSPAPVLTAVRVKPASACSHARRHKSAGPGCPRSHARLRVLRKQRGVWHVSVRASGHGNGVVAVRCRRRPGGQVDTVLARTTRLPRSFRATLRCFTRPRAVVFSRGQTR